MHSPASLLSVARQVGNLAGLEPSHVQRCYTALQAAGLLPRSHGRSIHLATPQHVATLIIGLAADRASASLRESVVQFSIAGKDGAAIETESVHAEIARLLMDPAGADRVEKITFDMDRHHATILRKDGAPAEYYAEEETIDLDLNVHDTTHDLRPLIASDRVVSGKLLQLASRAITWHAGTPDRARDD